MNRFFGSHRRHCRLALPFFLSAMAIFFISFDYSILRPVSNVIFISAYSECALPYAWIAMVLLCFFTVSLYNKLLYLAGTKYASVILGLAIISGNTLLALGIDQFFFVPFLLYVWKEIYLVLILQHFWSCLNAKVALNRARLIYGVIFSIGTLGSILGSSLLVNKVLSVGSKSCLFVTLLVYPVVIFSFWGLWRCATLPKLPVHPFIRLSFFPAMRQISASGILSFIAFAVIAMQAFVAIIDYQFHAAVARFPCSVDQRTVIVAKIFRYMHCTTLLLQSVAVFLATRYLGILFTHFLIPILLSLPLFFLCLLATPFWVSVAFVVTKGIEFSLFAVLKEMLYIPLNLVTKFQIKVWIDLFFYRAAKIGVAFLLCLLQAFCPHAKISFFLSGASLGLLIIWAFVAYKISKNRWYTREYLW